MNLALFFEGTGQGVRGKKTNVSLVYEACVEDDAQKRHLEAGPGAHVGVLLLGKTSGVGWRVIFARARRWYEAQVAATRAPATARRHDSLRLVSNLFGLLRPARRLFSPSMRRHDAAAVTRATCDMESEETAPAKSATDIPNGVSVTARRVSLKTNGCRRSSRSSATASSGA